MVFICLFPPKHCPGLSFPEIAVCSKNWNSALPVGQTMGFMGSWDVSGCRIPMTKKGACLVDWGLGGGRRQAWKYMG